MPAGLVRSSMEVVRGGSEGRERRRKLKWILGRSAYTKVVVVGSCRRRMMMDLSGWLSGGKRGGGICTFCLSPQFPHRRFMPYLPCLFQSFLAFHMGRYSRDCGVGHCQAVEKERERKERCSLGRQGCLAWLVLKEQQQHSCRFPPFSMQKEAKRHQRFLSHPTYCPPLLPLLCPRGC